jgi:hypothetical protein
VRGNPNQTQSHSSTTSLLWTDLQAPERRKLLFIWSLVIRQTEGLCILFTQSQLRYEAPTLHSNSPRPTKGMYHYLDEAFLADHRQTEVSILFVNFADYCSAGSRRCNLRCTEIPRYFGMSQAVYLSFFLRNILYSNCAHPLIERSLLMFSAQYFAHTAHISSTSISSIPAPHIRHG